MYLAQIDVVKKLSARHIIMAFLLQMEYLYIFADNSIKNLKKRTDEMDVFIIR